MYFLAVSEMIKLLILFPNDTFEDGMDITMRLIAHKINHVVQIYSGITKMWSAQ